MGPTAGCAAAAGRQVRALRASPAGLGCGGRGVWGASNNLQLPRHGRGPLGAAFAGPSPSARPPERASSGSSGGGRPIALTHPAATRCGPAVSAASWAPTRCCSVLTSAGGGGWERRARAHALHGPAPGPATQAP